LSRLLGDRGFLAQVVEGRAVFGRSGKRGDLALEPLLLGSETGSALHLLAHGALQGGAAGIEIGGLGLKGAQGGFGLGEFRLRGLKAFLGLGADVIRPVGGQRDLGGFRLKALDGGLGIRPLRRLAGDVAVQVADMALQLDHALLRASLFRFEFVAGMGQALQGSGGGGFGLSQGGDAMG
jgi:hypothetical protein